MIKINNLTNNTTNRRIADIIEPFIVKEIQRKNHTLFVYRCSDYSSFQELIKIHQFNISNILKYKYILEKYWSAIDILYIKIEEIPIYNRTKEYFQILNDLQIKQKMIFELEFFEVKLDSEIKKPILSVRTYELLQELKNINKNLNFIHVKAKGYIHLITEQVDFNKENYIIQTHYGRKHYYLYNNKK